jgi:hypothetical protein
VKFQSRAIICNGKTSRIAGCYEVLTTDTERNESMFGISECHRNSYPAVDDSRRRTAAALRPYPAPPPAFP